MKKLTFLLIAFILFGCNADIKMLKTDAEKAYKSGDFEKAISLYNKIIKAENEEPLHYFYRGRSKYEIEKHQAAIEDFTKAIQLTIAADSFFVQRGRAYYALENYEKAEKDFRRALKINSQSGSATMAYCGVALIYYDKLQFDQAIFNYNAAIDVDAKNHIAYSGRGMAKIKLGFLDDAIIDFDLALAFTEKNGLLGEFSGV
jgi:tetratricopeptide (TPR) repeat protein